MFLIGLRLVGFSFLLLLLGGSSLEAQTGKRGEEEALHRAQRDASGVSRTEDAALIRSLEHLERKIKGQLEESLRDPAELSGERLSESARLFRRHIRELERAIRVREMEAPGTTDTPVLLHQVRTLKGLVGNLELVASGNGAPDARPFLDGPARKFSTPAKGPAPANDACLNATRVDIGSVVTGDTTTATEEGVSTCGNSPVTRDVWFKLTAQQSGDISIDTFGSDFATVLSVHTGCPQEGAEQIICSLFDHDDEAGLQFSATAGETYFFRLGGLSSSAGSYILSVGEGGGLRGRVTDAVTGDPLTGGSVEIYSYFGLFIDSVLTGPDGVYATEKLSPGDYTLRTRGFPDHLDELYRDLPCPGDCNPIFGTLALVTSTGDLTVDFALDQGSQIRGTLTHAATGDAVAGRWVEVYDAEGEAVGSGLSDASGAYEVGELYAGTYFAVADDSDFLSELYDDLPCPGGAPHGCDPTQGTPLAVAPSSALAGVDFALDRAGIVSGTLRSFRTGAPLPSIIVDIRDADGRFYGTASTDASGTYSVGGLLPGTYLAVTRSNDDYVRTIYPDIACTGDLLSSCDLASGTPLLIDVETTLSGIDIAVHEFGAISGTVTNALTGDPFEDVEIHFYRADGRFMGRVFPDASGAFIRSGLHAGTYFARTFGHFNFNEIYNELPCLGHCDATTGTPIAVTLDTIFQDVDFTLVPGGSISGRVTEAATGAPIEGALIFARPEDGVSIIGRSDASGEYEVTGLLAGRHSVYVTRTDYESEVYDDLPCGDAPCDPTLGVPVDVVLNEETPDIDVALSKLGEITGTVTREDTGDPISPLVDIWDENGTHLGSARAAADGSYKISGLFPGDYFLTAGGNTYVRELYLGITCPFCDVTIGTAVTASKEHTVSGIDFRLLPSGSIQGEVTFAGSGLDVRDGRVKIFNAQGAVAASRNVSSGSYRFRQFVPGTYFAVFENDDRSSYVEQLFDSIPCPYGVPAGCDPTTGTPIVVNGDTRIADFAVEKSGKIQGEILDQDGNGIGAVQIDLFLADGKPAARSANSFSTGFFEIANVYPGTYFLVTRNTQGYLDEIFGDLPCPGGSGSCDATQGTALAVAADETVRGVDIRLEPLGAITGQVRSATSSSPIENATVRAWDADDHLLGFSLTDSGGGFQLALGAGTFYLSTEGVPGYHDEVYGGGPCPGSCVPSSGAPVVVDGSGGALLVTGVDFELDPRVLYGDDFESGNLSAWSSHVGGL